MKLGPLVLAIALAFTSIVIAAPGAEAAYCAGYSWDENGRNKCLGLCNYTSGSTPGTYCERPANAA